MQINYNITIKINIINIKKLINKINKKININFILKI